MGKVLYKAFKAVFNEIFNHYHVWVNMRQRFSYFIPEHRNFEELTRLSEDIKKPWPKENLKEIDNLIKNQTF